MISSYGIFPEIEGSQGPNKPYAGSGGAGAGTGPGTGAGGGTKERPFGGVLILPFTGGCLAGVCKDAVDGDGADPCADIERR